MDFDEYDDIESNDVETEYNEEDILDDITEEEGIEVVDENGVVHKEKIMTDTYKKVYEIIEKEPKKTLPILTKFEKARILGVRMQQISSGAPPLVNTKGLNTIVDVVKAEIMQRKIPFIIRRTLPNGKKEDWRIDEFQVV